MNIDIPFIPGILILIVISVAAMAVYMNISNEIGEIFRSLFKSISNIIKK